MIKIDFPKWLEFHLARFSSVEAWMGKLPQSPQFPGQPTQAKILDAWYEVLADVSLDHAKRASQLLAIGEENLGTDRGFDGHPRVVRRIARDLDTAERRAKRQKKVDGEDTFDCAECLDRGWITIWQKDALRVLKEMLDVVPGPDWRDHPRWQEAKRNGQVYETCAFRCSCAAGQRRDSSVPTYSPQRHVAFRHGELAPVLGRLSAVARQPHPVTGLSPEF